MRPLLLLFALAACKDADAPSDDSPIPADDSASIDADNDGVPAEEDCDDSDASVGEETNWYADNDGDTYGDPATAQLACDGATGQVPDNTDCDDANGELHPGAVELCDGQDQDCDGVADDGAVDASTFYADNDDDGYGDIDNPEVACLAPTGFVDNAADCDDADNDISPDATEICNGEDDNCDGQTDESTAADATWWYLDADNDGYGDQAAALMSCEAPSGHVADATDCDDGNVEIHPNAPESCSGDNDCDGLVGDDDSDTTGAPIWYIDQDNDGFGSDNATLERCTTPTGYAATDVDCDDGDGAVNPDAAEVCNDIDDDCDALIDDDDAVSGTTTWYADLDLDGYGDPGNTLDACDIPSGYTTDTQDCDDSNNLIYPGATESCDGVDEDCDTVADAGLAGEDEICATVSCLDIYSARSGLSDGLYWLDPQGLGPEEVWCDMQNGGWTLVYQSTNAGGLAENGVVTSGDAIGATPFTPTTAGLYKLADADINALRSGSVANDLKVRIEIGGVLLGESWHPSTCTLQSGTGLAASDVCNASTTSGASATNYTQSGHPGSLTRWYVDSSIGYIWPYTHIGPISGGHSHGGSLPNPYCTWYDTRVCPTSSVFQIWAL